LKQRKIHYTTSYKKFIQDKYISKKIQNKYRDKKYNTYLYKNKNNFFGRMRPVQAPL